MDLTDLPTILVLGASGLIGQAVAEDLIAASYPVVAVARRFTPAQKAAFGGDAVEAPFVGFDADQLAKLLSRADIVLNCVGLLQDGPSGRTGDVHASFVARLVGAVTAQPRPALLLHLSIPGDATTDVTPFSRTKREAERLISASDLAFAILRPGFVIAPAAYGGSALVRALATLPLALDATTDPRPFAVTAVGDIAETVKVAARLWREGWPGGGRVWDVMATETASVGEVIAAFRGRFGGPQPALRLPGWLMSLGALAGDGAGWLGWSPPIRTTALRELRRGVRGDPTGWINATGLKPVTLVATLAAIPATVQERWFARLYLAKPVIIAALALFWAVSGVVALGPGHDAAVTLLTARSIPPVWAKALTDATALADIAVGLGIALRRTCRLALAAGLALSLGYLAAASVIAPSLWADPLGPLVKIAPVVVLMLVALAILPER